MTDYLMIQLLVLLAIPSGIIGCVVLLQDRHDLAVLYSFLAIGLSVVGMTLVVQQVWLKGIIWMIPLAIYLVGYGLYRWLDSMDR